MNVAAPTRAIEQPCRSVILIVDDEPGVRGLLSRCLSKAGYPVLTATTGEEGLSLAREHRPDVVLLDVILPGLNGLEVCRQIKADPVLQGVFVLLMSGFATDIQSELGGRESGADDYLCKPFNLPLLLARLRTFERMRRAEAALRESEANYRGLFDNLSKGIARVTSAGRILMANPALARMLGYDSPGELMADITDVGRQLYVEPQRRPEVIARLERDGCLRDYENQAYHRDGHKIWVVVNAHVRRDAGGNVLYYESVIDDITDQKRTEAVVKAMSSLGKQLNQTRTLKEAARIILGVADQLLGWDACLIDLVLPGNLVLLPVLAVDCVCGQRQEVPPTSPELSALGRRIMEEGAKLILRDNSTDEVAGLTPFGDPSRRSASLMFVPIRHGDQGIGILSIQSYTARAYSPGDLQILQALGDYCGGAFERIQAEEQLRGLNQHLEQRVLDRTAALEAMNRTLTEQIAERARVEAALRESEERQRSLVAALQEGMVLHDGQGVIRSCNASAQRLLGLTENQILGRSSVDPGWRVVRQDGTPFPGESHPAMVTLRTGQPQSNVVMGVHRPDGTLIWISVNAAAILQPGASRPTAVVVTFADITERQRAMEAIQDSSQRIWEAQEAERQRVSRDLHDGVGQLIASVRFRLRGLEAKLSAAGLIDLSRDAGQAQAHLERAMDEVRRVARNLRPGELDDLGFMAAINGACAEFTDRTGVPVQLDSFRLPRRLAPELELALYRIVQEALTNVERHAQATRVTLRLAQIGRQLVLTISDNGRGFAVSLALGARAGLGIVNILERATHLGGKATLDSRPGAGTEVTVCIPLNPEHRKNRHGPLSVSNPSAAGR